MANKENSEKENKERFSLCPQCGRKGMYHIKLQYYRCRYCGTYIISPEEKIEIDQSAWATSEAAG